MDFLEFYNLKEHPFSNTIDSKFFFSSSMHSEALLRLKYSIDSMKGLAVVVGDVGTGKTTLARRLLDELDEENYEAALLIVLHASVTSDWLMKRIAVQLGVEDAGESKLEILSQLHKRLLEINESGLKAVVIMDEVQMLKSKEIMEEFRGLLNLEVEGGNLLTLVLFGLPELEDILAWDMPLKQRVAMKYKMLGFDEGLTREYINHRLKIAGCEEAIFSPGAITTIHNRSRGVPRLINTVCDNAILEGFFVKKKPIDEEIIESIADNLDLNPDEAGGEKKEAEAELNEAQVEVSETTGEKDEPGQED
jgi:type II secretory pathway predicted ATPase ExeA